MCLLKPTVGVVSLQVELYKGRQFHENLTLLTYVNVIYCAVCDPAVNVHALTEINWDLAKNKKKLVGVTDS